MEKLIKYHHIDFILLLKTAICKLVEDETKIQIQVPTKRSSGTTIRFLNELFLLTLKFK